MTSQSGLALAVVATNSASVAILGWKMFWIKMAFASVAVFRHFAANGAGESPSGKLAEVLGGQVLQPVGLLRLSWNHQSQFQSWQAVPDFSHRWDNIFYFYFESSAPRWMIPRPMAFQAMSGLTELTANITGVSRGGVMLGLEMVPRFTVRYRGLPTDEAEKIPRASSPTLKGVFTSTLKVRIRLIKRGGS